jgi:hypothetical protein
MKVKFDIECTPEEARQFIGLPDVAPMQEALMKQLQTKLAENIRTLDPEALARTWIPLTMQGWGDLQKSFWSQMNTGTTGSSDSDDDDTPRAKSTRRR